MNSTKAVYVVGSAIAVTCVLVAIVVSAVVLTRKAGTDTGEYVGGTEEGDILYGILWLGGYTAIP